MSSWCFFSSETTHGYKSQKSSTEQCTQLLSHRSPEAGRLNSDDFSSSTLLCTQISFLFLSCHRQLEVAHLPLLTVSKCLSPNVCLGSRYCTATVNKPCRTGLLSSHLFRARKSFPEFPWQSFHHISLARIVSHTIPKPIADKGCGIIITMIGLK